MTISIRMLLVAVVCVGLGGAAAAQPPMNLSPGEMLKRADADGDGTMSRDEFIKARTADLTAAFDRLDTNGDGRLDAQEAEAAAERMRTFGGPGREGGFRRPEGERPMRPDGEGSLGKGGEWPQRPGAERPERAGGGAMGEQAFDRLDGDGDGRLSREEFANGMARMRESMQRGGGRPGAAGGPGMPDRGGRGPEQGFRKPPQQD